MSLGFQQALGRGREAAGWISWTCSGMWFDLQNGMETTRHISADELGLETSQGNLPYEPAGTRALKRIFDNVRITPDDVLLDLGCGKGRVVFWVGLHCSPKRIVGVEISEQLYAVARRNLAQYDKRGDRPPVELVHADAATFHIPSDATLIFLNNPFGGQVFDAVLSNIVASVGSHPRSVRVIAIGEYMRDRYIARGFTARALGRSIFEYLLQSPVAAAPQP
jgi:predicted RNA methylase